MTDLLFQSFSTKSLALPYSVVGILNRKFWQMGRLIGKEGGVMGRDFFYQNASRPAIKDNVMRVQQQHMILFAEFYQRGAKQRAHTQIERRASFLLGQPACLSLAFIERQGRKIGKGQRNPAWGRNDLDRLAFFFGECRPQDFMATQNRGKTFAKDIDVQISPEAQWNWNVVSGRIWFEAV